jgi:hypothetical protein
MKRPAKLVSVPGPQPSILRSISHLRVNALNANLSSWDALSLFLQRAVCDSRADGSIPAAGRAPIQWKGLTTRAERNAVRTLQG